VQGENGKCKIENIKDAEKGYLASIIASIKLYLQVYPEFVEGLHSGFCHLIIF
jgi:hypothetical protein